MRIREGKEIESQGRRKVGLTGRRRGDGRREAKGVSFIGVTELKLGLKPWKLIVSRFVGWTSGIKA